jgi:D-alanyl-D-alanine dipeptidase
MRTTKLPALPAIAAAAVLIAPGLTGCVTTRDDSPQISPALSARSAGMVDAATLVPGLRVDMRYASTNNFMGTVVMGYEAPRCYLLRPAAEALQRVQASLNESHQRLQVFDCYRPVRAVQHFVRWAADFEDQRTKPQYYPNIDKRALIPDYIASKSGHSRGATLDLTLAQCDDAGKHCEPLDMGTTFDFLDTRANTDFAGITPEQRANRQRLKSAMEAGGFKNYSLEWWHYTLDPEPAPDTAYDFVVR